MGRNSRKEPELSGLGCPRGFTVDQDSDTAPGLRPTAMLPFARAAVRYGQVQQPTAAPGAFVLSPARLWHSWLQGNGTTEVTRQISLSAQHRLKE